MKLHELLYRQKSRWKYHTAKSEIEKRIAEINRDKPLVVFRGENYYVPDAFVEIPKAIGYQVFTRFDLFMQNMNNLNGTYILENGNLFFLFDDFKIQIVSANELFIINEIFSNNCYNFSLAHAGSFNVIDVGMNVGLASLFFANKKDVSKVFSFEPFPQTFALANRNFERSPDLARKIKSFNFGLGNGERTEASLFNPYASGTSGAFLKSNSRGRNVVEQSILIKDASSTIADIIEANGERPFVLKIDCEGAEYEIMESLIGGGFPEEVIAILMEWHGSVARKLADNIVQLGFKLVNTSIGHNTGLIYAMR